MVNLILNDRWQSEGQGDGPSGTGGSDNRMFVSWNSRFYVGTVDDIKDALDDQADRMERK